MNDDSHMHAQAKYSSFGYEDGGFGIARSGVTIVQLPTVTVHCSVSVCEFKRLDATLSGPEVDALIRQWVLHYYADGAYIAPTLELVDLDAQQWSRAPFDAEFRDRIWIPVSRELPPDIETRTTALAVPEAPETLRLQTSIAGYPRELTAMCASPDGLSIAAAHGDTGIVSIAHLGDNRRVRLPPCGTKILSLEWGSLLVANVYPLAVLVWENESWSNVEPVGGETARATWSPDARDLLVAGKDGKARIIDWETKTCRLTIALSTGDDDKIWTARYSADGERLFVGHYKPRISVWSASDGRELYQVCGTQHYQNRFQVGPDNSVMSSIRMKIITVFDARGEVELELANPASFGLTYGGFARNGTILVTQCNETRLKVYRRSDRALLGTHKVPKEPLVVLDEAVVFRNSKTRRLEVRTLPQP